MGGTRGNNQDSLFHARSQYKIQLEVFTKNTLGPYQSRRTLLEQSHLKLNQLWVVGIQSTLDADRPKLITNYLTIS